MTSAAVAWSLGGLFTPRNQVGYRDHARVAWRVRRAWLALALLVLRRSDEVRALKTMGWLGWLLTLQGAVGMTVYCWHCATPRWRMWPSSMRRRLSWRRRWGGW